MVPRHRRPKADPGIAISFRVPYVVESASVGCWVTEAPIRFTPLHEIEKALAARIGGVNMGKLVNDIIDRMRGKV
jgi:hypothetical protein